MKIKTKKTMNLPQLIEYAWDNDVKGENFPIDQNEGAGIYIATNSDFVMTNADYIRYNNTFTVEVEEEIDEDTVLPRILVKTNYDDTAKEYNNSMINEFVPIYCSFTNYNLNIKIFS